MNCLFLVLALGWTIFLAQTAFDSHKAKTPRVEWVVVIVSFLLVYVIPAFLWFKAGIIYGAYHA